MVVTEAVLRSGLCTSAILPQVLCNFKCEAVREIQRQSPEHPALLATVPIKEHEDRALPCAGRALAGTRGLHAGVFGSI